MSASGSSTASCENVPHLATCPTESDSDTESYDPEGLGEALTDLGQLPTTPPQPPCVFVMPDVERNGKSFRNGSVLSFAVVAVDRNGHKLSGFYAKLEEREDCPGDTWARNESQVSAQESTGASASFMNSGATSAPKFTHDWWLLFPEQYAEAILHPRPIEEVLRDFADWVGSLETRGKVVWCGGPVSADWPWLKLYADLYGPEGFSLGHTCKCLSTLSKAFKAMYEIGDVELEAQVHRWCIDIDGEPHDPRYDAYCQARTFAKMAGMMGVKF